MPSSQGEKNVITDNKHTINSKSNINSKPTINGKTTKNRRSATNSKSGSDKRISTLDCSVIDAERSIQNPDSVRPRRPKSVAQTSKEQVSQGRTKSSKSRKSPEKTDNGSVRYYRRLFDAVYGNEVDAVKQMVRVEKLNVNVEDEDDPLRPTPLLVACQHQLVDVVRVLVKAKPKADVNQANTRGRRPIWWAAKHGNKHIAEMLIYDGKEDCAANVLDEDSGCTPLYRAILSKAPDVCRLLVHAGADVNLRRLWKNTGQSEIAESPLVKAVQMGSYEICDVLINSMCEIQMKTEDGFTALHYAVGYRQYAIVDLLLENRIRVNVKSRNGATAMTIAIREQLPVMCRKLIEWGLDLDRKFKWDETPLEMAIRLHAETCAMILVQWGCKIANDRPFWYFRKRNEPPSLFRRAADEGLVKLMQLMIAIHPYFLYEEWISTKQLPLALYRNPGLCKWLYDESSQPRTLKVLCKSSILKHLGRYSCNRLEKLQLPEAMKGYLRTNEHFSEKMLREIDLYAHECPYHCPSLCARSPQCPQLDFSDSASDND